MKSEISNILRLIDDYKYAWIRYYNNDDSLLDSELCLATINIKHQIIDALNLLVGGSK